MAMSHLMTVEFAIMVVVIEIKIDGVEVNVVILKYVYIIDFQHRII
jgi:hypothetical protein